MNPLAPGAHVVQALAERFDQLFSSPAGSGKECNCVLQLLSFLYNFKVKMRSKDVIFHHSILCFSFLYPAFAILCPSIIPSLPFLLLFFKLKFCLSCFLPQVIHCILIYDIIRRLVASFSETAVELLLLLLKSQCWFSSCYVIINHVTVMRSASHDSAMLLPLQTQAWR